MIQTGRKTETESERARERWEGGRKRMKERGAWRERGREKEGGRERGVERKRERKGGRERHREERRRKRELSATLMCNQPLS